MAKLTIEIDMEDPQDVWDALYRRIEEFGEESADDKPGGRAPNATPVTYDLLLDPERMSASAGDFFAMFTGQD